MGSTHFEWVVSAGAFASTAQRKTTLVSLSPNELALHIINTLSEKLIELLGAHSAVMLGGKYLTTKTQGNAQHVLILRGIRPWREISIMFYKPKQRSNNPPLKVAYVLVMTTQVIHLFLLFPINVLWGVCQPQHPNQCSFQQAPLTHHWGSEPWFALSCMCSVDCWPSTQTWLLLPEKLCDALDK